MHDRLENMFTFLIENRHFNHSIQEKFYLSAILPYNNTTDKVVSLLYYIANTQSQPKIDNLAKFYKYIIQDTICTKSMKKFIEKINPDKPLAFDSLYNGMKNQEGWGKKTSALFVKSIYHLHNGQYSDKLKFWNDVPLDIIDNDDFHLPVDTVIITIFKELDSSKKWNFDTINSTLKAKYSSQQIEVWDDLWFWGFITQTKLAENRVLGWNENKYWALKETNKKNKAISEIKAKAKEFLMLLTDNK